MLHLEKYIPGPVASANLAATVVINCAASSTTVTGAPLLLEFDRVFDRQAKPIHRWRETLCSICRTCRTGETSSGLVFEMGELEI